MCRHEDGAVAFIVATLGCLIVTKAKAGKSFYSAVIHVTKLWLLAHGYREMGCVTGLRTIKWDVWQGWALLNGMCGRVGPYLW